MGSCGCSRSPGRGGAAQRGRTATCCRAPGCPRSAPGGFPARGRTGRLRDAAINRLATRLWDRGVPTFNTARAELGLAPVTHVFDQHDTAARVLVLTSRAFDFPAELPPNVRYVGPQLDDPDWTEPAELPPGDEPLVLVGMSSTFMDQADLLRRVVAALDQLPVRGLVTTGPAIEPSAPCPAPRASVVYAARRGTAARRRRGQPWRGFA